MSESNGTKKEEAKPNPITHIEVPGESEATPDAGADADGDTSTKPTLAELAEAGLAPGELEMAKKQGIVEGEPGADKTDKSKDVKDADKGGDSNGIKKEEKEKEKSVDERYRVLSKGKSPEQIMAEIAEKGDLSPEQETVLLASLSQNGKSLYWGNKKERKARQKLESDLVTERESRKKEVDDLKAQLKAKPKVDDLGLETEEEIDPKKKPLTIEELEKIDAEKATKAAEEAKKRNERASVIKEALDDQQAEAKERYEDFDAALGHTTEILAAANAGELDKLYPDPRQRSRITNKVMTLLRAFANADAFSEGDFNAADLSYELGKEHPEFGKTKKNNVTKNDETDADGDPEKAARVITNANRRGSSATLAGGGSRRVALEELTPEQAARLPTKTFNKLPLATRERLLGKK